MKDKDRALLRERARALADAAEQHRLRGKEDKENTLYLQAEALIDTYIDAWLSQIKNAIDAEEPKTRLRIKVTWKEHMANPALMEPLTKCLNEALTGLEFTCGGFEPELITRLFHSEHYWSCDVRWGTWDLK